jgi:hypothetical protein
MRDWYKVFQSVVILFCMIAATVDAFYGDKLSAVYLLAWAILIQRSEVAA